MVDKYLEDLEGRAGDPHNEASQVLANAEEVRGYEQSRLVRDLDESRRGIDKRYWLEDSDDTHLYPTDKFLELMGKAEKLNQTKEEIDRLSEKYIEKFKEEAKDYADRWETYANTEKDLALELGVDPKVLKPADFIESFDELRYRMDGRKDGELQAQAAAVRDFFTPPAMELKPWGDDGEIQPYARVPRMDILMDAKQALAASKEKGSQEILKISLQMDEIVPLYVGARGLSDHVSSGRQDGYLVLTEKVKSFLDDVTIKNLNGSFGVYKKGSDGQRLIRHGEYDFNILPVEALQKEKERVRIVLHYTLEDFSGRQELKQSEVIEGGSLMQVYHEAAAKMVNVDMKNPGGLVNNAVVYFDGRTMPWEEFVQMANAEKAA